MEEALTEEEGEDELKKEEIHDVCKFFSFRPSSGAWGLINCYFAQTD